MGQPIHALPNLYHHIPIMADGEEVVLHDDFRRYFGERSTIILIFFYWRAEVEVFNVDVVVVCTRCGDDVDEVTFDDGQICGEGCEVTVIVYSVPSNS